jgi:hypothetical protein
MDLTPQLVDAVDAATAAERWAACGGMWLTGRSGEPARGAPSSLTTVLDGLARRLATLSTGLGRPVDVDGPALLGERAAISGLGPRGDTSCGGSTRLLRSADGWVALSLARPDDIDLLPAWLGLEPAVEVWPAVAAAIAARPSVDVVGTGAQLGLAVSGLGERSGDRAAVCATRLGEASPTPSGAGLLVVDLSSLWAGPLCGQLLAATAMHVVKVESTVRPDGARQGALPFFDVLNGAKSMVALDFASREGVTVLERLLAQADVVIEASRPRALEQLGVDLHRTVVTGRTKVWLSITAHGRAEPYATRTGFGDDTAVAGGLVGHDGAGPVFCADAAADPATGLLAATAVLHCLVSGGRWLLDVALARTAALLATGATTSWRGPPAPPQARPVVARAAPLGADTDRVLDQLGIRS